MADFSLSRSDVNEKNKALNKKKWEEYFRKKSTCWSHGYWYKKIWYRYLWKQQVLPLKNCVCYSMHEISDCSKRLYPIHYPWDFHWPLRRPEDRGGSRASFGMEMRKCLELLTFISFFFTHTFKYLIKNIIFFNFFIHSERRNFPLFSLCIRHYLNNKSGF